LAIAFEPETLESLW